MTIQELSPSGAAMDVASKIVDVYSSGLYGQGSPGQRYGASAILEIIAALRMQPGGADVVNNEALADIAAACTASIE